AERGAVLGRDVVEVARGNVAAGARHVLCDYGGIARQMAADMPRHDTAPEVVAAAWPEADDHLHRLAGERVAGGLGVGRGRNGKRHARAEQYCEPYCVAEYHPCLAPSCAPSLWTIESGA